MVRASQFLRDAQIRHSSNLIAAPKVSVVLPTYCRGSNGLLARAIESVLSQSFGSLELIVVDDGSTDGTSDVLADFIEHDDRVIHLRHDQNSGFPALRVNEGLLMARGTYCAYQFDDDQWTPDALRVLTAALEADRDCGLAYGKAQLKLADADDMYVGQPFNYSKLVEGNFIANNSVLHRRSVFEQYGGYDMHIVMRRLCDWDLWQRWGRVVRFQFVDEVVSIVSVALEHSLGTTAPLDAFSARAHMAHDRNPRLTPSSLAQYEIDDLTHLSSLGDRRLEDVWSLQVAPFQSRHRDVWPVVRPKCGKPLQVLVTKAHFDTTVDITINNFRASLSDDFNFTYVPQMQVDEASIECADILLLHRTIDYHSLELLSLARKHGKGVVYMMDDDLLSLHEVSPEFGYLAPGEPCHNALTELIRQADLVVTYSPVMQASVAQINPRNVLLETNIPKAWLATANAKLAGAPSAAASTAQPVKVAFAGGGARREEFQVLWPAIVEVSRRMKDQVEFHFWGFEPNDLGRLESPYSCEQYTFSYDEYLSRLTQADFDVMIAPLFTDKRAKRAKCPIKFLEITAAGALGVYSDVQPYAAVVDGVSGLKCANTIESWIDALLKAINLDVSERQSIVKAALKQVERRFTSEAQANWVGATFEAAMCHARLNRPSKADKPRIAYFCHSQYLGGAENHLLRHALLAQQFGFEALFVLPYIAHTAHEEVQRRADRAGVRVAYLPLAVETEVDKLRDLNEDMIDEISWWLRTQKIGLVHSVTLMREVGEACRRNVIPHVTSLYASNSTEPAGIFHCDVVHSDSLLYANQWGRCLGAPAQRILSHTPNAYFEIGQNERMPATTKESLTIGLFGTVQARKGQLQAVEAIGMLQKEFGVCARLKIYGYDQFFPEYVDECWRTAKRYGVERQISFEGFVSDTASTLKEIDIVLCASDWESLPQVILEGMAARRLVVTPLVGGVGEVISNRNGVVIRDNSASAIAHGLLEASQMDPADLNARLSLALQVAEGECSRDAVAKSLFKLYQNAMQRCAARSRAIQPSVAAVARTPQAPIVHEHILFQTLERVRTQLNELNGIADRIEEYRIN
ncbi:hypothetical protein A6V36_31130 [Paraburkholderia ginsengiterrae]|uniref:Glycosyltransferase 2-like domain-containing protein n=1 Tax=Paraburkholderia ginsengiterrae TaxID=1462993 RepID=A0A1A9MWI6_9BURK|nr:glycosyltransferase [Paraburkholderia ginsengiterrae]OAJ51449.1 hypothetical protein A6V37_12125 [Paraburkholderia ginsengiterrae]OAJ57689.1 hypothetical protein A6V36_31130 [Paraburkholderia ginsengiterrae]